MKPHAHHDPSLTAAQSPSYAAQRLFWAIAAINDEVVEEWDVPGAYPRANTNPNFRVILRQPKRSNGSLTNPGKQYLIAKAQQGAPDAGFRWESHQKCELTRLS
jgi:hypothetical protein